MIKNILQNPTVISAIITIIFALYSVYRFYKRKLILVSINDDFLQFNRALTGEFIVYGEDIKSIIIESKEYKPTMLRIELKNRKRSYLINECDPEAILKFSELNKISILKKL